jgi:hypothetical protein
VRGGARDAAEAEARLSAQVSSILAELAATQVLAECNTGVMRAIVVRLDTFEEMAPTALLGEDMEAHWAFCVSETRLTEEQVGCGRGLRLRAGARCALWLGAA